MERQLEPLEITNPNTAWVKNELEKLYLEWVGWQREVAEIKDQPYDQNIQLDVFADGEDMMHRHTILQAKTLTFLNNNIRGHGFVVGFDGTRIDDITSRLRYRVKHRIADLEILRASLQYAIVPEGYFKKKGREIAEKVVNKSIETGGDIIADYLKNPFTS
ncbi:MAG: hypothetical protein KQH53_09040 [Desulfarculaceae bacterium]|nr:hypothetical protein [Desulfarculaceae bacterium]